MSTPFASIAPPAAPPPPGAQRITVTRGITAPSVQVDVQPDPDCPSCHGKGSVILLRHGARTETPCPRCVKRRAVRFVGRLDAPEAPAAASNAAPAEPVAPMPERAAQLERLRGAIADLERQRAASIADHDGRVSTATGNESAAGCALDARRLEVESLRADAAHRRDRAAELRRQADALDDEAEHLLSAAAATERNALPPLVATKKGAAAVLAAAKKERDRVATHFDRRLAPLRAREARIMRRLGPAASDRPA